MAEDVKQEMNATPGCIPSKWTRNTVADGDWLQKYTIAPLSSRDNFLADKISGAELNIDEEIEARKAGDAYLSANLTGFSAEYFEFKDNVETSAENLSAALQEEIDRATNAERQEADDRANADIALNQRIDKLEAATDVVMVFSTYDEFSSTSGDVLSGLTDRDVVKVLRDEHYIPEGDPDESSEDDDYFQVYYQWHDNIEEHRDWTGWSAIGSLDPYYSISEIDTITAGIYQTIEDVSATVSSNYLSANTTAVQQGHNIQISANPTNPYILIETKDNVTFDGVSSTTLSATTAYGSSAKFDNISSTSLTTLTATGNSAEFGYFSGTNIRGGSNTATIDGLIGSAHSGAEASAWIYENSARLDIQAGYGLETGEDDEHHLVIGLHQERCDYNKYGLALGSWCTAHTINIGDASFAFGESCVVTGGQGTFAAGSNVDITGRFSCGLGDTSNINGNYSYSIGEQNNLTADRQYAFGQGLSGNSFMIGRYNEVEPDAQFVIGGGTTGAYAVTSHKNLLVIKNDVISGRDFSAGDVSLSSLTNISAFGNGITNTATFNLSAVKLSAGQGISFKNDTNGVLSISAEGRAYTGENYVKVDNTTKKIGLSGDLVGSAESGQSAYDWITTKSATLYAGSGINFYNAGSNRLGIAVNYSTATEDSTTYVTALDGIQLSAGANYIDGHCIKIESDNSINLSSDLDVKSIVVSGATHDPGEKTLKIDYKWISGTNNSANPDTFYLATNYLNIQTYQATLGPANVWIDGVGISANGYGIGNVSSKAWSEILTKIDQLPNNFNYVKANGIEDITLSTALPANTANMENGVIYLV